MTAEKKENRGGKRREGLTQVPLSFRIDRNNLEGLKPFKNRNRFINEAIREKLQRLEIQIIEAENAE